MSEQRRVGVLLMTYGSPATLDDVPAYLANVRGGRPAEPELVTEFKRRYHVIGGSPLLPITRAQAAALEQELNRSNGDGATFRVEVGMRFAPPYVREGVQSLAQWGAERIAGVIMSPQYSPILMSGYVKALEAAVAELSTPLPFAVAGAWHRQPGFQQAIALRITEALQGFPMDVRDDVEVLLTAHSMPRRVVDGEPDYIAQLHETAEAVAALAGLGRDRWQFCYQSAGHTPEEWLKPDFADMMPQLAAAGKRQVLIAPVQFLADHLEILYDIEIGAREQAEPHGITFRRTESLNTEPLFIAALADVATSTLEIASDARRR